MASTDNAPAYADKLIDWAQGRVADTDWSGWVPELDDPVVAPRIFQDQPPLTLMMVVQCASLHAWLEGRPVTPTDVEALRRQLAEAWQNTVASNDFWVVRAVLADVLIWGELLQMPELWREALRPHLLEWMLRRPSDDQAAAASSPATEPDPPDAGGEQQAGPTGTEVDQAIKDAQMQGHLFQSLLSQGAGLGPKPPGFF